MFVRVKLISSYRKRVRFKIVYRGVFSWGSFESSGRFIVYTGQISRLCAGKRNENIVLNIVLRKSP